MNSFLVLFAFGLDLIRERKGREPSDADLRRVFGLAVEAVQDGDA